MAFRVNYEDENQNIRLELSDITGRQVYAHDFSHTELKSGKFTIPSHLYSGIYILSIKSGNKIATRKIEVH